MPDRKPFAVANWKMAMTIPETLAFVHGFCGAIGDLAHTVDIVLCPPYTALHAVAQALAGTFVQLGAQNLYAAPGKAHTGEISAPLLADVGCGWVLLGHWEIRRRTGETDADVNRKLHAAFRAGLRPILLVGEAAMGRGRAEESLVARLPDLLAGCEPEQVTQMAVVYEPEWTIGVQEPASPDTVTAGCAFIRRWIGRRYGPGVAEEVRIIYGGSVAPEYAEGLLASPQVDGLGASRKGRDPSAFAEIVRLIAVAKGLT
ncbi:MAG: triose-phosphate isomerase family protein [Anaerolineae bacterium]